MDGPLQLKAGAARVDITPDAGVLPEQFRRIEHPIYARVLVLDNGTARAVLVLAEVPTIAESVTTELKQRLSVLADTDERNILVGCTHTHNSIRLDRSVGRVRHTTTNLPGSDAFLELATARIADAVDGACAKLQPARIGYASADLGLIVNRNQWLPEQHRYIEGADRSGTLPIDQRLGVLTVQTNAGEPIAFLLNYGIEPVVMMSIKDAISGDVPGLASRYVEDRVGGDAVALFMIGSTGKVRWGRNVGNGRDPIPLATALATILGEESLAISAATRLEDSRVVLMGLERAFECPGKVTTPLNESTHCDCSADPKAVPPEFKNEEGPPVTVAMGLLRIGDLAIVQVDANVSPAVWLKLAAASPFSKTALAALAYGPVHYVVSDADYPLNTYEATASMAKAGYAEENFIETSLEMLAQAVAEGRS